MDAPEVLAFHLGDTTGGAHRVTWDGTMLRYARYRDGFEKLREAAQTPEPSAWEAFRRAVDKVDPWGWAARYGEPAPDRGERWSLELSWDGRTARTSGEGAYPPGFDRFKLALWALLGNPPAL